MKDLDLKQNVLQEIMDLMEEREGSDLKKHPKLMASKIEVENPESEAVDVVDGGVKQESDDELSPEDVQKLIAHFQGL